eukprot:PhM_4_TR14270/c2_g4_i1/m.4966
MYTFNHVKNRKEKATTGRENSSELPDNTYNNKTCKENTGKEISKLSDNDIRHSNNNCEGISPTKQEESTNTRRDQKARGTCEDNHGCHESTSGDPPETAKRFAEFSRKHPGTDGFLGHEHETRNSFDILENAPQRSLGSPRSASANDYEAMETGECDRMPEASEGGDSPHGTINDSAGDPEGEANHGADVGFHLPTRRSNEGGPHYARINIKITVEDAEVRPIRTASDHKVCSDYADTTIRHVCGGEAPHAKGRPGLDPPFSQKISHDVSSRKRLRNVPDSEVIPTHAHLRSTACSSPLRGPDATAARRSCPDQDGNKTAEGDTMLTGCSEVTHTSAPEFAMSTEITKAAEEEERVIIFKEKKRNPIKYRN